ncbi:cytochrome d ubiquinol oxidase subunit II [Bosea robiniae]|uniref:Cytochrome d ubiquinol oxidase subunit II n=1 Tax=Bosea robiniae TaxID=1036780 RepID=A0ABY0NI26_9HYPH|nr:cytochrome d ubiquinol oxidase subunit II [Bosea robiniae]SDF52031.1 cytochrome d ubiquinol oxidase subunit II [Bosea robiniae]
MEWYLPVIWAGVIGTAVMLYVILDGFDLGIAILFPTTKDEGERDQMMNSVAPFWDGNETWLVLGGAGLWVAFPYAYAIIMPAFYIPVILMLLALIFRGVAFEFRWVAKPHHKVWDLAFWAGSTLAAFAQGLILGGLLQGVKVVDKQFAGGPFDWLTPFTVMCGIGVVIGYATLGATWLVYKTEGPVADRARRQAKALLLGLLAFAVLVSLWTPYAHPRISARWFTPSNLMLLWPLPVLTAICGYFAWKRLHGAHEFTPFALTIAIFVLCFLGLAVSNYPYLVPPDLTIWDTAAAPSSHIFVLIGVSFLLPTILFYTAFVYWTFRGKVRIDSGYH